MHNFRKQVEQFLYKSHEDRFAFDTAIDVDEEEEPVIHGYCTPVNVDEESNFPFEYQKTSKPIAVDSAIANTVWDTIIEEEEEEFEEVIFPTMCSYL